MKKKFLRITAILLMLAMTVTMLCSCNALDEKKKRHAVWADESHNTILLNGKKYVKDTENAKFFDGIRYEGFEIFFSEYCVTDDDVPDLIANYFGTRYTISVDGKIIRMSALIDGFFGENYDYTELAYVLEDEHDEIVEKYKNIQNSMIEYCIFDYVSDEMEMNYRLVDNLIREILNEALHYGKTISGEDLALESCLDIYKCDREITVAENIGYLGINNGKDDSQTYIFTVYEENKTYVIDSKYDEIIQKFIDDFFSPEEAV